jgi:hypothetical protein
MTNYIVIKRLCIIKKLFQLGVQQADLPEILSFSSVLTFHDSIDMFMQLAVEKNNITDSIGLPLMQYFKVMPQLVLEASVQKINERRKNLKHRGQIPAKIEVEESRAVAGLFFEENTPIIFGINFQEVSLSNLISDQSVRKYIVEAESSLNQSDFKNSILSAAKAYFKLEEQQNRLLSVKEASKFREAYLQMIIPEITKDGSFIKDPFNGGARHRITESQHALHYFYSQNFGYIYKVLSNISLGVDYRSIVRFKQIVPEVLAELIEGDSAELITAPIPNEDGLSQEKVVFVIQFIIDFALGIQAGL